VNWRSSWKKSNVGSAIKDAASLPTKAQIPESVIDKPLTIRGHCAAVTKALVFQKRLNNFVLQQL